MVWIQYEGITSFIEKLIMSLHDWIELVRMRKDICTNTSLNKPSVQNSKSLQNLLFV